MVKFLIIRFSSIGDIVLTTPVIRCLREQVPAVELDQPIARGEAADRVGPQVGSAALRAVADLRPRGNTWFIPYETIQKSRPHPTVFPAKLPEMCLKLHGLKKVNLAMDPFMGIGSTAVACKKLNVDFLGFEIDKTYVEITRKNLSKL